MRFLIRQFDYFLRKCNGVFEFSQDEDCLVRLHISRAAHILLLPDTTIAANDPVLRIHLWNEHMPAISSGGADLAWARRTLRRFIYSLRLVEVYLRENPRLNEIRAIGGVTILLTSGVHASGSRFVQDLGFTVMPHNNQLGRFCEFWENFYTWVLIWTFNPGSLSSYSFSRMHHTEMWISRGAFLERFSQMR